MARVQIPYTTQDEFGNAQTGLYHVYTRGTTTAVPVYAGEVGGSALTQPIAITNGQLGTWVDEGSYDVNIVTSSGSTTRAWEAVKSGGAPGATGPPGVGAVWRGVWSSATTYAIGDGVYFNDRPYISNAASNLNHNPLTAGISFWAPLYVGAAFQMVDDLSAAPRSVTDWGPLINTALAAGTRHFVFGPFDYPFTTMIDGRQLQGILFQGAGGYDLAEVGRTDGLGHETGHSRLIWGGTGAGHAVDFSCPTPFPLGNLGSVFQDLMILYSSGAYTGALVNFKNASAVHIHRCFFGSTSDSLRTAQCALSLDGINTIEVANSSFGKDFASAAVRGRESGGAGFSNEAHFSVVTFNDAAVVNPGLEWVFDRCIFEFSTAANGISMITTDFTYGAQTPTLTVTLRDCSYWDANNTMTMVTAPAGNDWDFEAVGCKDRNGPGNLAKLYNFQCTGRVRLIGGYCQNIVDMGDGTATARKLSVVVLGTVFDSTSTNLLVNATKGHLGVHIMAGSLGDQSSRLGVSDGVATLGHEIANVQNVPTVAAHAGATGILSVSLVRGNDMSGVILVQTVAGSPSSTGLIIDVTLNNPPYSTQGPVTVHTEFPIVQLTPCVIDDGGNFFSTSDGPKSAACGAYTYAKTLGNSGSQGSWSIGVGTAIPANSLLGFAYRVIHI